LVASLFILNPAKNSARLLTPAVLKKSSASGFRTWNLDILQPVTIFGQIPALQAAENFVAAQPAHFPYTSAMV